MWTWIHKIGSPKTCYRWATKCQPWFMLFFFVAVIYGVFDGLAVAPSDYQQGDAYRIMFLHVPAAIMSLAVYMWMATNVIVYFIWKIKTADVFAKASAPLGAIFTVITLIAGSLWGKPEWGTFWIWDARLTSELILLFIYFGIMALRSAIPDQELSARASGIMTLIGVVNIPIVHYSVDWWHTLHQGATILQFAKPSIASSMLHPLLAMIAAYLFYFAWMMSIKVRSELLRRESKTQWVQQLKS